MSGRNSRSDPVTPAVAAYVMARDRSCRVGFLAATGRIPEFGACSDFLTFAHVRDSRGGRLGKRPPSTPRRLAVVCTAHHTEDPIVDQADVRPVIDRYLELLEGDDVDHSRPWEKVRRIRASGKADRGQG
jgi:hypothetical protein